jgi:hypothetical protein
MAMLLWAAGGFIAFAVAAGLTEETTPPFDRGTVSD